METVTLFGTPTEHRERKQKIENAGREVEIKPVAYMVTVHFEDGFFYQNTFLNFDKARKIALFLKADLMPVV